MSDEARNSFADITKYLSLLSAYSVGISVLFLWATGGVFNVKILEYMSLSDVVKAAAGPMVWVVVGAALGALAGEAIFGPDGPGKSTAKWANPLSRRATRRLVSFLTALYALTIVVLLSWDFHGRWQVLSLLICLPFAYLAGKHRILAEFVPNESARAGLAVVAILVPAAMYERGLRAGADVAEGREYDYLVPAVSVAAASAASTQPRLLGHAGDVYFLWNPVSKSLTLTKLDSKSPREVVHWRATKQAQLANQGQTHAESSGSGASQGASNSSARAAPISASR